MFSQVGADVISILSSVPGYTLFSGEDVSRLEVACPIKHELSGFKADGQSGMNLGRGEAGAMSDVTWMDYAKTIRTFLGFCHTAKGVPTTHLSLRLFSQPFFFVEWLSFMLKNTRSPTQIVRSHVSRAKRVIHYLSRKDAKTDEQRAYLRTVSETFGNFVKQVHKLYPTGKKPKDDVVEGDEEERPGRFEVQQWVVDVKARAVAALFKAIKADRSLNIMEAKVVADWCLVEWLTSIPPLRLFCIRTIQAPATSATGHKCHHKPPRCNITSCRGNRLEFMEGSYYSAALKRPSLKPTADDVGAWVELLGGNTLVEYEKAPYLEMAATLVPQHLTLMRVVLPHHKMDKLSDEPISIKLPYDLALTTQLYLKHARPILAAKGARSGGPSFLFLNCVGKPLLEESSLTNMWYSIQATYNAPWMPFPPNDFRHIHVEHKVKSLVELPGAASLQGDAAIMGNTVGRTWTGSYMRKSKARSYKGTMMEAAVDSMTKWRHSALKGMAEALREQQAGYPNLYWGVEAEGIEDMDYDDGLTHTAADEDYFDFQDDGEDGDDLDELAWGDDTEEEESEEAWEEEMQDMDDAAYE